MPADDELCGAAHVHPDDSEALSHKQPLLTEAERPLLTEAERPPRPIHTRQLFLYLSLVSWACFCIIAIVLVFNSRRMMSRENNKIPRGRHVLCNDTAAPQHAVATILTAVSDEYIELVVVLGTSIALHAGVGCTVDRIVMLTADAGMAQSDRRKLERAGWTVRELPNIPPPASVNMHTVRHARYLKCFSKLHAFNMTEYASVLLLDADTMVHGSVAELFTVHAPHMQKHGVHLAMARDLVYSGHPDGTFNAGVMLVRPSRNLTEELLANPHNITFDTAFAEQGFLVAVFNTTHHTRADSAHKQLHVLPQKFNLLTALATTDRARWRNASTDARIVHFTWAKPTASFMLLRCAYMGTLHFCRAWTQIRRLAYARADSDGREAR